MSTTGERCRPIPARGREGRLIFSQRLVVSRRVEVDPRERDQNPLQKGTVLSAEPPAGLLQVRRSHDRELVSHLPLSVPVESVGSRKCRERGALRCSLINGVQDLQHNWLPCLGAQGFSERTDCRELICGFSQVAVSHEISPLPQQVLQRVIAGRLWRERYSLPHLVPVSSP